jgi:hypothetical protein
LDLYNAPRGVALFRERYAALVRKVIFRLQRIEASGIFGNDYQHRTLWDEYCHENQNGPHDVLGYAWEATLGPILQYIIETVPHHEAVLLSIGAKWNLDEDIGNHAVDSDPDLIRRHLKQETIRAAMARDLSRFDPLGDMFGNSK